MIKEQSLRSIGLSLILPALLISCGGGSGGSADTSSNNSSAAIQSNEHINFDGIGTNTTITRDPSTSSTGSTGSSGGSNSVSFTVVDRSSNSPLPTGTTFEEVLVTSTAPDAFGVVLDSAVSGLRYKSGTHYGVTDSDGAYGYIEGEMVEFFIGDIIISAQIAPAARITPYEMADGDPQTALNIASFLQTLDNDADPSNGIQINDAVHTLAAGATVDFSSPLWGKTFTQINLDGTPSQMRHWDDLLVFELTSATEAGARYLVSEDTAYGHLSSTLSTVINTLGSEVKSVAEASTCREDAHCQHFQLPSAIPSYACSSPTSVLYSEFDADIDTMQQLTAERDSLINVSEALSELLRDPNFQESGLCSTSVTFTRNICGASNRCEVTTAVWTVEN